MVVVDTDFIIAVLRGDTAAAEKLERLREENICMTSVTAFELLRGVSALPQSAKRRAALSSIIEALYVLDFGYLEADAAARIEAELAKEGTPIGTMDVLIASACIVAKERIVTRNARHFDRIPGLKVESW